jgi:rod shape determining protein RodA
MTPLFKKFLGMHWLLAAFMGCLLAFGVYAIFNASAYKLGTELENKWYDQLRWISMGAPFFFAASLIDYKWIRWACWPLYLAGIGGLVATLAFGVEIGGNPRSLPSLPGSWC